MSTLYIPKTAGKKNPKIWQGAEGSLGNAQLWPEAPHHIASALFREAQIEATSKEQKSRTIKAQSPQKSLSSMITTLCL